MTPNTRDNPEAIRNRNIAAVSPPMNWLNRKEGSIGRLSLYQRDCFAALAMTAEKAVIARSPRVGASRRPRTGSATKQSRSAAPSLQQRGGVDVFGFLHHRERHVRVLDHLAPEL